MTPEPAWAQALYLWIEDDWLDSGHYPEDHDEALACDAVVDKMRDVLCETFGHHVVDDHCGIPEHRFCTRCQRREPVIIAASVPVGVSVSQLTARIAEMQGEIDALSSQHEAALSDYTRARKVLQGIADAWSVEGHNPSWHRYQVQRLRDEWPTLVACVLAALREIGAQK